MENINTLSAVLLENAQTEINKIEVIDEQDDSAMKRHIYQKGIMEGVSRLRDSFLKNMEQKNMVYTIDGERAEQMMAEAMASSEAGNA